METNKEVLLKIGCKEEGFIIIPPTDKIVPVDTRRLNSWSKERLTQYIKDIEDAKN